MTRNAEEGGSVETETLVTGKVAVTRQSDVAKLRTVWITLSTCPVVYRVDYTEPFDTRVTLSSSSCRTIVAIRSARFTSFVDSETIARDTLITVSWSIYSTAGQTICRARLTSEIAIQSSAKGARRITLSGAIFSAQACTEWIALLTDRSYVVPHKP